MKTRTALTVLLGLLATAPQTQPQGSVEPQPALSGQVLDALGQPVRKAAITLTPVNTWRTGQFQPPQGTEADTRGNFAFYEVPAGSYRLSADRPGYLTSRYGARSNISAGMILNIGPADRPAPRLTLRMTPQAVLSGRVSDASGRPAAGAIVRLLRRGFQGRQQELIQVATATTEHSGEFSLNKVAEGLYFLRVDPKPLFMTASESDSTDEKDVPTYFPGVSQPGAAEPIVVTTGQIVRDLYVPLRRSATFHLRGQVSASVPDSSGVRVILQSTDNHGGFSSRGISAPTAVDGSFDLTGVVPGVYILAAFKSEGSVRMLGRRRMEVSQNLDGIVLNLEPTQDVRGVLVLEEKLSAPALQIGLTPADGFGLFAPAASITRSGPFVLSGLISGKYTLSPQGLPYGAFLRSVTFGGKDALGPGIELSDETDGAELQIVIGYSEAEVMGTVHGPDQRPSEALVTLVPDPPAPELPWLYQVSDTAGGGQFQFLMVPPGRYRIYAWERLDADAHLDPEFSRPHESRGAQIEVKGNGITEVALPRITSAEIEEARLRTPQ